MARLPRYTLLGQPQHVIVRGNNRAPIFCADEDYQYYLEKLEQACKLHAYYTKSPQCELGFDVNQ